MAYTDDKQFIIRDESGRGCCAEWTAQEILTQWTETELSYSEVDDEDDLAYQTVRDFIATADVGDEFPNTDDNWTLIRVH